MRLARVSYSIGSFQCKSDDKSKVFGKQQQLPFQTLICIAQHLNVTARYNDFFSICTTSASVLTNAYQQQQKRFRSVCEYVLHSCLLNVCARIFRQYN